MTIAIGSWVVSTFFFVLIVTLAAFLLGCWLASKYWRAGVAASAASDRAPGVAPKGRVVQAMTIIVVLSAVGWGVGFLLSDTLGQAPPTLPDATFLKPDGQPFAMRDRGQAGSEAQRGQSASNEAPGRGHVTVVNLWASWCGPCRREMPAFVRAQARHPTLRFIYANQGETAAIVDAFLQRENLHLDNVVMDPDRSLMTAFHTAGIPTTLFFDARGALVSSRVGELSDAALEDEIAKLQAKD